MSAHHDADDSITPNYLVGATRRALSATEAREAGVLRVIDVLNAEEEGEL